MGKNPCRELLNRIKYDPAYDPALCFIEYEDFEGENCRAEAPLLICEVESNNINCSGAVMPFQRTTGVTYNHQKLYPEESV